MSVPIAPIRHHPLLILYLSGKLLSFASNIVESLPIKPFQTGGGCSEWSPTSSTTGDQHQFSSQGICIAVTVRYGELGEKCPTATLEDRRRATYVFQRSHLRVQFSKFSPHLVYLNLLSDASWRVSL